MPKIHPTAIIEGNVSIGSEVEIGPYARIKGDVTICDGTIIETGTCIYGNVIIGESNKIGPYAIIGSDPQDLKYKVEEVGFVRIGNGNVKRVRNNTQTYIKRKRNCDR